MKDIPEWALERAAEEANKAACIPGAWNKNSIESLNIGRAFAAYIAENEEPPVDPDLIRARDICAELAQYQNTKIGYRNGTYDSGVAMRATLKVLKEKNS